MLLDCLFCVQFGMMQKLSTGNHLLDTFLVMLLPLFFSTLVPFLKEQWQKLMDRWSRVPTTTKHTRRITFTYPAPYYDYNDNIAPNHKLQAAILLHLNNTPDLKEKLCTAEIDLIKASNKAPTSSASDNESDASSQDSSSTIWYEGEYVLTFRHTVCLHKRTAVQH